MSDIQYLYTTGDDKAPMPVRLDGKIAGEIRFVGDGWRYFPKGQKEGGELFSAQRDCQKSLEDEPPSAEGCSETPAYAAGRKAAEQGVPLTKTALRNMRPESRQYDEFIDGYSDAKNKKLRGQQPS